MRRDPRWEDWEWKYRSESGNRFAWLGNGYSQTELDETADWGYYIRDRDDDPPASRAGKRKVLSKSGTVKPTVGVNFTGKVEEKVDERANL